ncbi:hypothetical protein [Erythrobacter sp. Alg231-14]|uniref:hypothetical protein n=1 Tax=Erythrobacter sp. Alg231-14 TaxID=1922225 RepID=UPI00307B7EC0
MVGLSFGATPAWAQNSAQPDVVDPVTASQVATYADIASLAERSDLVIRAEIRRQTVVEPERSPGLAPGFARLYIEARTQALLSGSTAVGESLDFLIDVPLNARGKPDKYKNRIMLLFADAVPGRRGTIQLTGRNAMLEYSPDIEARIRPILTDMVARDAPPVVTNIRDALAVPGTLSGESETQIFLETRDQSPVSITVLRRPGQRPVWGVSWGEIIDSSARAPRRDTLRWYRLACALPKSLPSSANLARDPASRRLADADYAVVRQELGTCAREITSAE